MRCFLAFQDRHPKRGLRGHADQTAFTSQLQSLLVRDSQSFLGRVFFVKKLGFFCLPTIEAVAFESTQHINTYILYVNI